MRVLLRADASSEIGWGHVMRCLTLAHALARQGAECVFVCRDHPGNLSDRIRQQGFDVHLLRSGMAHVAGTAKGSDASLPPHYRWLGADWRTDAGQTVAVMDNRVYDWIVVDHYALDARWHDSLRPHCKAILAIDDLADRRLEVDAVLDQNLGREPTLYEPWIRPETQCLLGPRYALLRPEFEQWREASLARREKTGLSSLLVTLGGTDTFNFTPRLVRAVLDTPDFDSLHLEVVLGRHAPGLEAVRALERAAPDRLTVHCDVERMAPLMAESDLCIGAAGSTAWERCCLGLPALQVVSADNQIAIARALEQMGAALTLDTEALEDSLIESLKTLSPELLGLMSCSGQSLCDGQGADRVANWMITRSHMA